MSDTLRSGLIRLAFHNPDLRADLLPLLTKEAAGPSYKDYVEKKRKKGEKPLDEEAWESRVKGKGEDKSEEKDEGSGKTVGLPAAESKKLGEVLSQWHSSASDPIYAVSSHANAGKPIPADAAKKALGKVTTMLNNADAYRLDDRDKKQLSSAKKMLEKAVGSKSEKRAARNSFHTKTAGEHPLGRMALVYFDLSLEDYNVEEDARSGDEFAQSLLKDERKMLGLENEAVKNLSRMFGTRINNEGHTSHGGLVCKFGVDSWDDVKKALTVINRHHEGGDDQIGTGVPYMVAQGFRLYPDGVNDVFYGEEPGAEGDWDEWLSEHKGAGKRAAAGIPVTLKKAVPLKDGTNLEVGEKGTLRFDEKNPRVAVIDFDTRPNTRLGSRLLESYFGRPFTKMPSMSALEKMSSDSIAKSVTGKKVEPDGHGPDGSPSWLLVLGFI